MAGLLREDGFLKTRHGLEIRAASVSDAEGLCDLFRAAGHVIATRVMAERLEAARQGAGAVLIAIEWGPPTGVIMAHWYRTLEADHPIGQVTTLLVAPEDRRRGIGRLLVKAAAQAARVAGCGGLELLARPGADALDAFCRATGFVEAGPRFARALRKNARPEL
jgi:GNAT superfamily N-acetyltransferase